MRDSAARASAAERSRASVRVALALIAGLATRAVLAGEADVLDVAAARAPDGTWRFEVTVRHADEGCEHYADAFQIVAPDGSVLGTRTLHHPHVDEQPFIRSLAGVEIPPGVVEVTVRARDSVHGLGGATMTLRLAPD